MDIFIYSTTPGVARDEIEDALEAAHEGVGEITGGGAGENGWNIDLCVSDCQKTEEVLHVLRDVLRRHGVMEATIDAGGTGFSL